ncbi:MAG: bifunctional diguanylate cyclase/phosphodiesterase [Oceanicoccus sp.]|nr:bifunctional diguanylate cyclase/phosphodiesterase [Oceanicoccus sp.]
MQESMARILLLGSNLAEYRRFEAMLSSIQQSSFQLLWCEQLENGKAEIVSGNYDAVLLDCQHQPDTALLLLQETLEQGCLLPIIALTAEVDNTASQQALQYGAADYLSLDNLDDYVFQRCIGYAIDKSQVEKKINQLNLYDPLTGIPNRMLFRQTMERAIELAKTQQISLALLLINLDGFKKVNESYGSEAGDRLVATMAQRLTRCVRKSDGIARVGGDEFTLVLEDCHGNDDVALVAKKVIDVLSAPFTVAGQGLIVSCSIGIAIYPEAGESVDDLLKRANMAMLEAKTQRGSQYNFYNEDTNADAMYRINLEADLRRALRNSEFEMHYQPRVAIGTGVTVGMEALIRWRHPTRGLVSPNEFIPVAEECGLIVPIGYWVIQQACEDMRFFDENGHDSLDIAINLSFKQLQDNMFVDTATRIIEQSGVDAHRLEFELTETAIMSNYQQTYEGMMALSKLGITFSLDDFGTGFSSFAHIQRLPISALKVDRSFVRNVVKNDDDGIIVKAMINLAHSLRLQVIAEGVETLEQVQFLWQNHCDQVQGFYFSPAVSATDFNLMIDQRATAAV